MCLGQWARTWRCKMFPQNFCHCHTETVKGTQGHYTQIASVFMHVISGISSSTYILSFFLSLHLCLSCVAWLTLRRILQLQERCQLCTTSMSSLWHQVRLQPAAVTTTGKPCIMISPGCVEQLIWRLIYVVVFSHAIKYNLLFPSNLGLYSLGYVKAKCLAFAARSLQ